MKDFHSLLLHFHALLVAVSYLEDQVYLHIIKHFLDIKFSSYKTDSWHTNGTTVLCTRYWRERTDTLTTLLRSCTIMHECALLSVYFQSHLLILATSAIKLEIVKIVINTICACDVTHVNKVFWQHVKLHLFRITKFYDLQVPR